MITCIANDYSFDAIFSRQVQALAQSGDILLVFSTSGDSSNIVRVVEVGRNKGLATIGLLGRGGGQVRGMVNYSVVVKSDSTARIQEVHTFLIHYFCEMVELVFNPNYRR
ncbi:MAG: SIS domain-containing protein [bacterium]|nr:SIS domain-containing protein [bacterium]